MTSEAAPISSVTPLAAAQADLHLGVIERRQPGRRFVVRCGELTFTAAAGPRVEDDLLDACLADGCAVLIVGSDAPTIVGALQRRLHGLDGANARKALSAHERVTLRAGKASLTLHADGTIELTGTQLRLSGHLIDLKAGQVKMP